MPPTVHHCCRSFQTTSPFQIHAPYFSVSKWTAILATVHKLVQVDLLIPFLQPPLSSLSFSFTLTENVQCYFNTPGLRKMHSYDYEEQHTNNKDHFKKLISTTCKLQTYSTRRCSTSCYIPTLQCGQNIIQWSINVTCSSMLWIVSLFLSFNWPKFFLKIPNLHFFLSLTNNNNNKKSIPG